MPAMSSKSPRTTRIGGDVIQTSVYGRTTIAVVERWSSDFEQLGGARFWLFDGRLATGYDVDAIDPCVSRVRAFAKQRMFEAIVVATSNRLATLGASIVRMTAMVEIEICGTLDETEACMVRRRAAGSWRRSGAWRL
jgi:hypothetical protein